MPLSFGALMSLGLGLWPVEDERVRFSSVLANEASSSADSALGARLRPSLAVFPIGTDVSFAGKALGGGGRKGGGAAAAAAAYEP